MDNNIKEDVSTGVSGMEGKNEPMNNPIKRKNKKNCKDCGMKSKEAQDDSGTGNTSVVKEFYISDEGYVLFMEAGVLKHLVRTVRDSKGKLKRVKKSIYKAPKNSGMKVYRSGKIKRDSTVKKNKIVRKKELKKAKRTLKKGFSGKMRRANLLRKKTSRLNRGKM